MERVADIFDRNGDGYVDHKEYIDTLRPDRDVSICVVFLGAVLVSSLQAFNNYNSQRTILSFMVSNEQLRECFMVYGWFLVVVSNSVFIWLRFVRCMVHER